MSRQTFPAGATPRILLSGNSGELVIEAWEERSISVESDDLSVPLSQEEATLVIRNVHDDIHLHAPADTTILVEDQQGDLASRGIARLQLHAIGGDLAVDHGTSLLVQGRIEGDTVVRAVDSVEIERVRGDLSLLEVRSATLGTIEGDCTIAQIAEAFRYNSIGGDLHGEGNDHAQIIGGSVGGDLYLSKAMSIQISDTGGDARAQDISDKLVLGSIGGDCEIRRIAGSLHVGAVGGDCEIESATAELHLGSIGGDLRLALAGPSAYTPEQINRLIVGGDAEIALPAEANLTIRACVGGTVRGERLTSIHNGTFTIVYGEGAARLDLTIGGDLAIHGNNEPRVASSIADSWDDFGKGFERMGEELGRMGEELGREIAAAFGTWGEQQGDKWAHKAQKHANKVRQQIERSMRHISDPHPRSAGDPHGHVHVRINDREWHLDPKRLERLKQQARQAAQEGVAGALEAVERALGSIHVPTAPAPPRPPSAPDAANTPPVPPPPVTPHAANTGETIRMDRLPPTQVSPNEQSANQELPIEADRMAILRMIAEKRITPEEGDMLLDALG